MAKQVTQKLLDDFAAEVTATETALQAAEDSKKSAEALRDSAFEKFQSLKEAHSILLRLKFIEDKA